MSKRGDSVEILSRLFGPMKEFAAMKHSCSVFLTLLLLLAFVALPVGASTPPESAAADEPLRPFLLGGIQTNESDLQRWGAALHQAGMNATQITVYAQQGPWNTPSLWYAKKDQAVVDEIRAARQQGLQVILVLRVALRHSDPENRFLWHGLTYPETEQATHEWFKIYTDFVVQWGKIAEREGVEVLGIASEMNAVAATLPVDKIPELPAYYLDDASQERLRELVQRTEHLFGEKAREAMGAGDFESLNDFLIERNQAERQWARAFTFVDPQASGSADSASLTDSTSPEAIAAQTAARIELMNARRALLDAKWRQLIQKVRRVYSGRMTLAANFDNYHEVSFWDALDFIGINAYFKLRQSLDEPVSEAGLMASWRRVFQDVEAFQRRQGLRKEVIFTELGYTRWQGVTVAPWSSQGFIPMWAPDGDHENDWAFFWEAQPLDVNERALAVQALHGVWREDRVPLAGVLYWKLSSHGYLQRFEPFMLNIHASTDDPLYSALTRFADGVRPFSPRTPGNDRYLQAVDAVTREDLEALNGLGAKAGKIRRRKQEPLLHLATRLGRVAAVERLLDTGARTQQRNRQGLLPAHWTCFQDDPQLVDRVLPDDRVSLLDARLETPLMHCARLGNEPVLERWLELRSDLVGAQDEKGRTALHLAVEQGTHATVEALLAAGADVDVTASSVYGATALHLAAQRGEAPIVRLLAKTYRGTTDTFGNHPAHWAAYYGHVEAFRLLFEPEHAQQLNSEGQGLVHLAAQGGKLEILSQALEHMPDVDLVDTNGQTPLAYAIHGLQSEAARLLLEKGATVHRPDASGYAPLHYAAGGPDPRVLMHVLELAGDFDLNQLDVNGNTPLHHAAGWGRLENVRQLLVAGADPTLRNKKGESPLDIALDEHYRRVGVLLSEAQDAVGSPAEISRDR